MPTSSSAPPIAITNVATLSAKYAVLSAVVSAVSVTHMLRSGFSTGLPLLGSVAAAFSSLVGLPDSSRKRPICAYVWPPVASSVCLRMTAANAFASPPVSTFWPGIVESGVPTICSRARSLRTVSRPATPMTIAPTPSAMRTMLAAMPPLRNVLVIADSRWDGLDIDCSLPRTGPSSIGLRPQTRSVEPRAPWPWFAEARSGALGHDDHGGAPEPAGAQVVQRGARRLQRVARDARPHRHRAGQGEQLLAVAPREVRDRADRALAPQDRRTGTTGCRSCGCRRTRPCRPSPARAARRARARRPGANTIAASSSSGGAAPESPAHSQPSSRAKRCVAASPARVNANTRRPSCRATWHTMCAAAPKP